MKIEVREFTPKEFKIYIDNKILERVTVKTQFYKNKVTGHKITSRDFNSTDLICLFSFEEIENLTSLNLTKYLNWTKLGHLIYISRHRPNDDLILSIYFKPKQLIPDQYTFDEYLEQFTKHLSKYNEDHLRSNVTFTRFETKSFEIGISNIISSQTVIEKEISNLSDICEALHNKTLAFLYSISGSSSFEFTFDFPVELKVSCEQYLIYFAQFLRDLGISAESNLKAEAGKVLFSVTPNDDVEALNIIREALAVYLSLPTSPIIYDDSFAAMRLQQQVENLHHSQKMAVRELQLNEKLLFAQSEIIREKNITISQQQSIIEQKDKIIEKISSKSIMMDSVENKEELEELCDGLKIGESKFLKEQLGIHLNPAKVIKTAVKNTFGKDSEKKSVLGLDEEE